MERWFTIMVSELIIMGVIQIAKRGVEVVEPCGKRIHQVIERIEFLMSKEEIKTGLEADGKGDDEDE